MSLKRIRDRKEPLTRFVDSLPWFNDIGWDKPPLLDENVLGLEDFVLAEDGVKTGFARFFVVFDGDQVFGADRFELFPEGLLWFGIVTP